MKTVYLLLIALIATVSVAYSKLPPHLEELNKLSNERALIINRPGTLIADGFYSPASKNIIKRLPKKYYLQNAIHIKTKDHLSLSKNKSAELTPSILSSTKDIGISKVRAMFAEFSEYQMLSKDKSGIGRIYELSYINPIDPYDACEELMKNPEIEYAVPVFIHYALYEPDDPMIGKQYYLSNIDALNAWEISRGSQDVIIGIVDSGIDFSHEDLAANLAPGGYDFVGNVTQAEADAGNWKADADPKPMFNNNQHGTHVTGCANAVSNNSIGIASPAMNCRFIPIKCGADNSNIQGIFRGYEAIVYAAQQGADIINCSWGGPGFSPVGQDAINQAVSLGAVVVVAAGNDNTNIDVDAFYPAAFDNVVCVGATNESDKRAGFSNYGHKTTLYAPGDGIYSTLPSGTYGNNDGTSMASPIAAGVAALVKSVFPNYTPRQIYHQLRSTCDNVIETGTNRPLYYGRLNAFKALSYNNKSYPDLKTPGCGITSFKIGTGDALTNNQSQIVKFTVENFLAPTSNKFKVKIKPLDYFVTVVEKEFTVGELNTFDSTELSINVQLSKENPWFSGFANILVTFEDGDYIDYKLFQIPIKINSDNSYSVLSSFPDGYNFVFNNGHSPSRNVFWSVGSAFGYYGVYYRFAGGTTKYNFWGTSPIYAIYGFDENRAVCGTGPNNGNAQIYITANGGNNWNPVNVSHITSFINDIHFFNDDEGVMIGDPKNNVWGVAVSNNGGEEWIQPVGFPAPLSGESNYVGASTTLGNNIWFGTSSGRVYRSMNKGSSWAAYYAAPSNMILNTAFLSKDRGMVIFGNSGKATDRYVATTTDGGQNWTNTNFNFADKNVQPIALYAPEGTSQYIALCKNGEVMVTHDYGVSWRPVLSKNTPSVSTGAGAVLDGKIRLWFAGVTVSMLDFNIPLQNETRTLSANGTTKIMFDSVLLGANKIQTLTVNNSGNSKTTIESISFEGPNAGDFSKLVGSVSVVEAGGTGNIRLRFAPGGIGNRTATLVILSNANPNRLEIPLEGIGYGSENKSITTLGVSDLNFDTVKTGQNSIKSFNVKNNGNSDVNLSISIKNENSKYSFNEDEVPLTLSPNQQFEVKVTFAPDAVGAVEDEIIIESNGEPSIITVSLFGVGSDFTGVKDEKSFSVGELFPNPVTSSAVCMLNFGRESNINATVVDLSGREIAVVYDGKALIGENILIVPVDQLSKGVYFLKVRTNEDVILRKFVVE